MDFKTRETIQSDLKSALEDKLNLDLTEGTTERDIFVEVPVEGQLVNVWTALEYLYKLQAPLIYYNDLLEEDLDIYCINNGVDEIPATESTGYLTFYTSSEPTEDIIITTGSGGSNNDGVQYLVEGYYIIPYDDRDNYYNNTLKRWEITCSVSSSLTGVDSVTGQGTVTTLLSSIAGIEGCTNNNIIDGGTDEGTILERLNLVRRNFSGRSLSAIEGIKLFVEDYSDNVNIVTSNDPLMLRTNNLGGGIDIYIRDSELSSTVDTITVTSTGLNNSISVNYDTTSIILDKQPVDSIILFSKNDVIISSDYYELEKDTGLLSKSSRSIDKLTLTSTGLTELGEFVDGDSLEIRYNYNSLLESIETQLNSPVNLYDNRDILLREQESFTVDIAMTVKLTTGSTISTATSAASLEISAYIEGITTGYVELIDILALIRNLSSIDNVDVSTAIITPSDGRDKSSNGDIYVDSNEYAELGTITFTEWTS